jgi:uncharacterized Tic20 family protein
MEEAPDPKTSMSKGEQGEGAPAEGRPASGSDVPPPAPPAGGTGAEVATATAAAPPAPPSGTVPGDRTWTALTHATGALGWLGLIGAAVAMPVPFLNIIVPFILWLIKKDEMPFLREQGKEVLNYQISWTIYAIAVAAVFGLIGLILLVVVVGVFVWLAIPFVLGAMAVVNVVFAVIGAISASDGKPYRYPLTIRFLK